jgi:hypothetical protein
MKKFFLVLSPLIYFLASCDSAKFDRYPGAKLDSIPQEFRGTFIDVKSKRKDTSYIVIGSKYWTEFPKGAKTVLGDSSVLSIYKGKFFYSMREENSPYWNVTYLMQNEDKLSFYALEYDARKPSAQNIILNYFHPVIDKDSNSVFKMDEEKLYEFCNKELLKNEPVIIKRVKEKTR